ncbi:MAG: hypothetical protein KUA33_06880 [Methanobacterium sp.]|nr:hypothetical protein [Methanobacterium sp.]
MANAILYKMGYKVGDRISHKVTSDALIVYIRNKLEQKYLEDFEEAKEEALDVTKLKANDLVESFEFERIKRSKFQYNMTEAVKTSKAKCIQNRCRNSQKSRKINLENSEFQVYKSPICKFFFPKNLLKYNL